MGRRRTLGMLLLAGTITAGGLVVSTGAGFAVDQPDLQPPAAEAATTALDPTPDGWALDGDTLTWRSPDPVPFGSARVEFRLDDALLGYPGTRNQRTFRLRLEQALTDTRLDGLAVLAAGRRLDLPTSDAPQPSPAEVADLLGDQRRARTLAADPGDAGPYATTRDSYELADLPVKGYEADVEVLGEVVRPSGAPGARPLVLFLHGRHATCFKGTKVDGSWPCRAGWQPIPSHLGYLQAQELLASRGYLTVSISANGINAQDFNDDDGGAGTRSRLVRHHLRLWAQWAGGAPSPLDEPVTGAVELTSVMLVGHSRGGEGVNRAAIDRQLDADWDVAGQVLIGPTNFGRQVAAGTPTAVLLPYCDGDVFDLQGQGYVDDSRDLSSQPAFTRVLRSSVLVAGANHNFFNAEWTPATATAPAFDDWSDRQDAVCGKGSDVRLKAGQQRTVGATYISTAAAVFLADDASALPLLDGSPVVPTSIGDAVVHTAAVGAERTVVLRPDPSLTVSDRKATTTRICDGSNPTDACAWTLSPHWLPMWELPELPAQAWEVRWDERDGSATVSLPAPVDLTGFDELELRAATEPGTQARFAVRLLDDDGGREVLGTRTVAAMPAARTSEKVVARVVRFPLGGDDDVDLTEVTAIEILPKARRGEVWVLDAAGRAPGLPATSEARLPTLSVVDLSIVEGDGGKRTEEVELTLDQPVSVPGTVLARISEEGRRGKTSTLTVHPGDTSLRVPFTVRANARDDDAKRRIVAVRAASEATTSDYRGRLLIRDDDPTPKVRAVSTRASTKEGGTLSWTLRLSKASNRDVGGWFAFVAPTGTELQVNDTKKRWHRRCLYRPKDKQPLSEAGPGECTWVGLRPGRRTASITLPTARDSRTESTEQVRLRLDGAWPKASWPKKLVLRGTVADRS